MTPLEQLGRDVADELDRAPTPPDELAKAKAGFLAASSDARPKPTWKLAVAGGAFALAAASVLLWSGAGRAPTAGFELGGAQTQPGVVARWMEASEREVPLRFSDGSTVLLTEGARGRVDELTTSGATLSLERGRAVVSVRHQPQTRWNVVAGPFRIAVTGTRFNVEWDPRDQLFTLVMEDGSVVVAGPPPYEHVPLVAGQTFRASLAKPMQTAVEAPPTPTPSAARVEPSAAVRVASPEPSSSGARAAVDETGWRELAQRGEYARSIQAVERDGASAVLASAGATDLILLGDAARFAGKSALAREAYATARSRFPGTPAAAQAAFALGRLGGDSLVWFQRYLAEAPDGPLAREALGRVLELQQAAAPADAAKTARRYLASFPSGPHAALAKSVIARDAPETPAPRPTNAP